MAHHLGMSLVAIDNALKDRIMQRRFMRDCSMAAFRELLQEKVPVGAEHMKNPARDVPEKPGRANISAFQRSGSWRKGEPGRRHLVSNGAYTVLCSSDGSSRSRMGSTELTAGFWVTTASFTPASVSYRYSSSAAWLTAAPGLSLTHTIQVPEGENGELRVCTLKNQSNSVLSEELVVYLEPILARERDFEAHPVFSKLFLESSFAGDGVVFTRRPRRLCEGTPSMAVLWDAQQVNFDTSREEALGRGGLRGLKHALTRPAGSTAGAVLDPCLLARIPLTLTPGERRSFSFAVAASDSGEDAVLAALRLLGQPREREQRRLDRIVAMLAMTSETALKAFELLDAMESRAPRRLDPKQFWPYGISGDLPLAAAEGGEDLSAWLKIHQLLTRCGYPFDLAFLLDEGGDYRRPLRNAILTELKADRWEHQLDARGGIHLEERPAPLLSELAANIFRVEMPPDVPEIPFVLERGVPFWEQTREGAFRFQTGPRLPPVGWSQMLCNENFGWFTDETGCGHLWLGNARENRLTAWRNDPLAIGGDELFRLAAERTECSLFSDADGHACAVAYAPGYAKWVKQWKNRTITATAFVPMEDNVRYLIIELEGDPCELLYRLGGLVLMRCALDDTLVLATRPDEQGTGVCSSICPLEDTKGILSLLDRTIKYWNRQVSSLVITTPNDRLNHYMNGWALYQVIACRLFGRTSRYQNGGAYGFRDQLQDVCAVLLTDPELTEGQVLRASERQFEEGDVQHWWHPPDGKGVRTRVTDDLLWLPYVLCEYCETYGTRELLYKKVLFLKSPVLACSERERYEQPEASAETGTVYEHAVRAVECALRRGTGEHGRALLGTGDWNDGMDLVGEEGKGESVWLTWFLAHVLERFASICERMGERDRASRYRSVAKKLAGAANAAWDGAWFLRGYYDDGSTLGSGKDEFCQIDSIAQSFSVLCSFADREKAKQAVSSAVERLFERETGIVKIFDPPFDRGEKDPGYIRGYVPGVRENGGQYTHAAIWLAMACFRTGRSGDGYDIINALLPANHDSEVYRAEPYVLSADVYSNPEHPGRGGWSWYTGAAGWYYRTVLRDLLGLRVREGLLYLEPDLPKDWTQCGLTWRTETMVLHVELVKTGASSLCLDGVPVQNGLVLAHCAGEHTLRFTF
jgi:cellobiose phosphorylase